MRERRNPLLASCFLPLVAIIILAIILFLVGAVTIPSRAREAFGQASPHLNPLDRYVMGAVLLFQSKDLTQPLDPAGTPAPFRVELNESTTSVIGRLYQQGLISDPGAFRTFLQYTGLDTTLQAGNYELSPAMSAIEIAHQLQDATPHEVIFHVLPGWRNEEIATALPTSGLTISPEAFLSSTQLRPANDPLSVEIPATASLEGFLFPGEYRLPRQSSAPDLIQAMLKRFDDQVSNEMRAGFTRQDLTLFQAVTLASIVQREAMVEDEMPLIASIFLNRLAADMNLASDPTVQYAVGFNESQKTWWTNPLSNADLQIDSLYNTYLYPGLPPGPIANPGLPALKAVAFPAQTSYYYFRALCDGSGRHAFSQTYQEHLDKSCP